MIEPVYVPYEQYRAAKTGCGLDSRIYGIVYSKYNNVLAYECEEERGFVWILPNSETLGIMAFHIFTVSVISIQSLGV
jgi:hypothetical protein